MDLHPKFIIEGDSLILSKVSYHRNLITDKTKVRGCGWFIYNDTHKIFIFHSKSEEFGKADIEDIKNVLNLETFIPIPVKLTTYQKNSNLNTQQVVNILI